MDKQEEILLDQTKSYFKLNHFVLWCKGWYKLTDNFSNLSNEEYLFQVLKKVLYLDDYQFVKTKEDILIILANNIRYYNEWAKANNRSTLEVDWMITEVYKNMNFWNMSYFESTINVIKEFFKWKSKIALYAPHYNKQLWKFGLTSMHNGNGVTYTWRNKNVSKYFLPAKTVKL